MMSDTKHASIRDLVGAMDDSFCEWLREESEKLLGHRVNNSALAVYRQEMSRAAFHHLLWEGKAAIVKRDQGIFRKAWWGLPADFIPGFPDLDSIEEEEA